MKKLVEKGDHIDFIFPTPYPVAFWVTNPCRITRKVEQMKMYVCTLGEFILVDIWIHCCASWNWICIGNAVVYIQSQQ